MKCSIVIPVFNNEETLDSCLNSLNHQVFNDLFEVVVVNDGSVDGTSAILTKWKSLKKIFKLIVLDQQNTGRSSARNAGVRGASGDIILFIGGDILVDKNWLSEHYSFHLRFPEKESLAVGHVTWSKQLASDRFRKWLEKSGYSNNFKGISDFEKLDYWRFYTGNLSVKKSLISKNEFDENIKAYGWEDVMLGYEFHLNGIQPIYLKNAIAYHNHDLKFEDYFPNRMLQSGISAVLFEKRYPKANVVPKGVKLFVFKLLSLRPISFLLGMIKKEWGWYALSKKYFLRGVTHKPIQSCLIIGSYGTSNIGDEAMLNIILTHIDTQNKYVLSGNCVETRKLHGKILSDVAPHFPFGIRSFFSFGWVKSFVLLKKSDIVVLGGGGLFTDSFSGKAVMLWSWHVLIVYLFGKKLVLFANSIGDIKSNFYKKFVRWSLNRCDLLILRDSESYKLALKYSKTKAILGSDLLYLHEFTNKSLFLKKRIYVNFRPAPGVSRKFLQLVNDYYLSKGFELFFVAMDDMDKKLANGVFQNIIQPENFDALLLTLNDASFVLGMRLHFLIAGALLNKSMLAFSYDSKVFGAMNDIGIPSVIMGNKRVSVDFSKLELLAKKPININNQKDSALGMFHFLTDLS